MIAAEYEQQVLAWRAANEEGLRRENGWLALAGLFWLNKGRNSLGSDPPSDIVLPEGAPVHLGYVEWDGSDVVYHAEAGQPITINGSAVTESRLQSSQTESPSFITLDSIRIVLHEHAGRYAFRIWDNLRPER